MSPSPLLSVKNLRVHFPVRSGILNRSSQSLKAVDDVSFEIAPGETLGLVGESGCGKSTLGKAIVRLLKPTSGSISIDGTDITHSSQRALRPLRKNFQMIFQDPAESLDPRMNVRQLIEEPFLIHHIGDSKFRKLQVNTLLDRVGLPSASADRFPFEFSGGQRQRIGIARALALNPKLIVCDEPVSALDVSVQSQILNLLVELQKDFGLSYLFIAHDLSVVKHISDRVAVMYLGKIVELSPANAIYQSPHHAYTKALLSAIPEINPSRRKPKILIEGDVPSPINPPLGSAFGHRIQHPNYQDSIGLDLTLTEIQPHHFVAADPCCLTPEDWNRVKPKPTPKPPQPTPQDAPTP